jgi:hypothetical protein
VTDGDVRAELARALELLGTRGGHHRSHAERPADLERREGDPASDAPDEGPLPVADGRLRDEHPIGGLEDERERRAFLERERVVERVQLADGNRLELAARAVRVLADDRNATVMGDPRVDHDPFADLEPLGTLAQRGDDAGAVSAEDARLGNRGQPFPDPDVQVVQARGTNRDERLACARLGIGDVLVAENLGASVLVDAHGLH